MCNNCNSTPCCCPGPCRYNGPAIECLNITPGMTYDQILELHSNEICDLLQSLEGIVGIDNVVFTSSSLGGAAGQAGATDTYTIWGDVNQTINLGTFIVYNGTNGTSAALTDSGWQDLEGFDYYTGVTKPQCRRLNNQIHFRGEVIIPIETAVAGIEPIVDENTYLTFFRSAPATAVGGVNYDSDDKLLFNNDNSVIPISVLPALTNLDGTYENPLRFASRQIAAEQVLGSGDTSAVLLSSYLKMEITTDKKLRITALETMEKNALDDLAFNFVGGSSLRNFVSSFAGRDGVINFTDRTPNRTGLNSRSESIRATSGALIVGNAYTIETYFAGDDFTNVGAAANNAGTTFIATGTTPTNWTNLSVIRRVDLVDAEDTFDGASADLSAQFPLVVGAVNGGIDAANPYQIGGFKMKIDGLIAYIT